MIAQKLSKCNIFGIIGDALGGGAIALCCTFLESSIYVIEMTCNVSSGTLNSTIPYYTIYLPHLPQIVCLYFEPFKSYQTSVVSERLKISTRTPSLTLSLKSGDPKDIASKRGEALSTIVQNFTPIGRTIAEISVLRQKEGQTIAVI